tara:strand:- start:920 stop:3121 length:2202 start_codon:yes stop_codon:yes gene_type:complete
MKFKIISLLFACSLASAQENQNSESVSELEALTIESTPLGTSINETSQAWSVLSGDELEKSKSGTIAESLSNVPGVSQSFFGPSANRPIIRGLDKNRVRMLQNGIDTFDVSAQSEDHAIPVDPLFVERIEILRGSSALLHGGSAIGGVVNVIDRSIPTSPYTSPGASLQSSYTSVNDGWNYGAMAFGGSETLSFQINGFKRDFKDYDTPTFLVKEHEGHENEGHEEEGHDEEGHDEEFKAHNKVENSYGDSSSFGFGGARHWDGGFAGISFSHYENTYGVPGAEHAIIELESDRFEARSAFDVSGSDWLQAVELKFGYGDYLHSEAHLENHEEEGHEEEGHEEGEHEEGPTKYLREGFETRIALKHEIGNLRGVFGLHGLFDELKIDGEESIFAGGEHNETNQKYGNITNEDAQKLAIFLIEEFDLSESTLLNAGIRLEGFDRDLDTNGTEPDVDDTSLSASIGFSHELSEGWNLSSNLNYAERLPDTAELYSYGAHHATHSFEVGDPSLEKETAVGIEVILRRTIGKVTGQLSAFHTEFDDYIFTHATGREHEVGHGDHTEHLPEMQYEAVDAEFQGLEAELDWLALENQGWSLLLSSYGDVLRGKNKTDNTHLPRVAPARLGVGFEIQADKLRFGLDLTRVFKQDRIPVHEEEEGHEEEDHGHEATATDAYSLLNAYAAYDLSIGDSVGEVFVRGFNLTDELGYNHTSPESIKSYAPLPGTNVEIGLKFDF